MRAASLIVGLTLALVACDEPPDPPGIPACDVGPDAGVWGYADLHNHPAGQLAFRHQLLWGSNTRGDLPVTSAELPAPDPCPVDSHSPTTDPLQRTAHTLVLGMLNVQDGYAHGPIATAPGAGGPAPTAWPNGRDVLHQQMHINAIRRAYEGGLRLMLASVTDNQVLAQLLEGPRFPGPFEPSREDDLSSARRQFRAIAQMANDNPDWMSVATSPEHAREIIRDGRLALVLSLEMDALRVDQILGLRRDFPLAHVVPIHLVDNDFGGAAAYTDIFNAASALMSPLFDREENGECLGSPLAYQCVQRGGLPQIRHRFIRPLILESIDVPLIYLPGPISFPNYEAMDYDDLDFCGSGAGAMVSDGSCFARRLDGHRNRMGVTRPEWMRELMEAGLVIDVSHMSYESVEDTLSLAESLGHPVIASHGDVSESADRMRVERQLNFGQAERLAALGGMIGLGTGRRDDQALIARWAVGPGVCTSPDLCPDFACLGLDGEAECGAPTPRPIEARGQILTVSLDATSIVPLSIEPLVRTFVEVEFQTACASVPWRVQAELVCDGVRCRASMPFSAEATEPDQRTCPGRVAFSSRAIRRVSVLWLRADDCDTSEIEASRFVVRGAEVKLDDTVLVQIAPGEEPLATLSHARGRYDLVSEGDVCRGPVREERTLLRIELDNAPDGEEFPGASIGRYGSDLCLSLRMRAADGTCPVDRSAGADDGGCPPGWFSVNHRGTWASGTPMTVYTRVPEGRSPGDVCGLNLRAVTADDTHARLDLGEVRLETIGDPVRRWMVEAAILERRIFGTGGRIAFGTDFNGGPPQLPISTIDPARIELSANGCQTAPLLPMRAGDQTIRIGERGLATVGQLPDFLAAVQDQAPLYYRKRWTRGADVLNSVFRTAETFIQVWERSLRTRP